jgi:hypothetical protein
MKKSEYKIISSAPAKEKKKLCATIRRIFGNEAQPEEWSEGFWEFFLDGFQREKKRRGLK